MTQLHVMPVQFGPIAGDSSQQVVTHDKRDVTIQLEVDAHAAQVLLPTWTGRDGNTYGYRPLPIGPTGKPVLFLNYTQERDVEYMAGGGYNEVEFYLSAEFVGENGWDFNGRKYDTAHGMFAVLLLPSHLIPLLVGREALGTPKHLADVTDLVLAKTFPDDEKLSGWFEARNKGGGAFVAGCLRNIAPVPYEVLKEPVPEFPLLPEQKGWARSISCEPGFKVMLWKYVAAGDWASAAPDLSYHLAGALDGAMGELSQPLAGDANVVFPCVLDAIEHSNFAPAFAAVRNLIEQHGSAFSGNVLIRHYSNSYRAQDLHIMDGTRRPAR